MCYTLTTLWILPLVTTVDALYIYLWVTDRAVKHFAWSKTNINIAI